MRNLKKSVLSVRSVFVTRTFVFFFVGLLLSSCGVDSNKFRLTGRLRNVNQAEFLIYSPDGAISGIDTIVVRDGRFTYETELRHPATFVVVFPNFSEQPVFAEPGEEVDIKGNASHMKEMIIKGTDDNDDMTELRMQLNELMPPDVPKAVGTFIDKHPRSRVSRYLLQRYFLAEPQANLEQAYVLASLLQKENPDDEQLATWKLQLDGMRHSQVNGRLTDFSERDVKGRNVSLADLKAKVNVITVWASWSYSSTDIQRRLQRLKKDKGANLSVVSICLDADIKKCRETVERDSLPWKTVCDGRMWQSPLISRLGICDVPGNIILNASGVIQARNLAPQQLEDKITQLLK